MSKSLFLTVTTSIIFSLMPVAASAEVLPGGFLIGAAASTGSTTATLAFTSPISRNGEKVLSYSVRSYPEGGVGTLEQSGSGIIPVTNLVASTWYSFRIFAAFDSGITVISELSNSITTDGAQPTATATQPINKLILAKNPLTTTFDVKLESLNEKIAPLVSVSVPPGTLTSNLTLTLAPIVSAAQVSAGEIFVTLSGTDKGGRLVKKITKPLTLDLGVTTPGTAAIYSADSRNWVEVPLITQPGLSDAASMGYSINKENHLIILTRNLISYGVKRVQASLMISSIDFA